MAPLPFRAGVLDSWVSIIESEWARVFPEPQLAGEQLPFLGPEYFIPQTASDFSTCN